MAIYDGKLKIFNLQWFSYVESITKFVSKQSAYLVLNNKLLI